MRTKKIKTLSASGLRVLYGLVILSMLLASVGIQPASAASPSTISGNAGVGGATITWNGSGSGSDGSMTADASGNYSFQVTYSLYWSGTVTPSKTGYTFSPTSRNYNFLTSNQTNQNYAATAVTYTISGSTGTTGANATITYTGGSATANSSGSYSFTVASGWSGTVTPSKTGYTFSPVNRSYSNVTSNQANQNYTATLSGYTISGNAGVNATITYTGGSTTANSSGDYSFFVSQGWSGTATPSKTGFSFSPASQTYTNVTANQTGQNYTPRPTSFTFASMGDASGETTYFPLTVNQIATLNPALVIFNGDLEANGFATSEMNALVGDLKTANIFNKTYLIRGNSDNHVDGSAAMWESYFETAPNIKTPPAYVVNHAALDSSSDNLVYSFDYGNSIFIGLDVPGDIGGSGGSQLLTDAQLTFLDARLTYAENAGLTHAFIFFHGPEYPVSNVHSNCATRSESNCTPPALMTIINNHPIVSATFHGHEQVLGWVHMDNTRISDLTRSYEEFFTSPSGGSTYNQYVYPDRVDYLYPDMQPSDFGFGTISVNGLSFTYNIYKVGTTAPVWSHTFSKANTPPTISDITDKTTAEDTATGAIPFTVGDAESNINYLTITASSSDTTLVPNENISLGGSGANRTLNILPAANENGSATITVSVNDGNVTTSDTFLLTVSAVNDAPVADPQSVSMPWNTSTNIVLTGSDVESSPLTYSIVDNPAHGGLSGSGANRTYTPTANYSGTDSFTFKANDGTVDSAPATVSINVTAYVISGNAGVAGATLSYTDGTPKTVTADGSGVYSFQVPTGWSGTVTPSKAGYTFSPESMSYTNVLADQTSQNYSTNGVMVTISGYAGVAGATLSYTDGTPKTATADGSGLYTFDVSYNWSGTVTPSKTGYGFLPASRSYTNIIVNQDSQDYTTTTARVWYVDKTNPNCTDTGQVASMAVPFCTINRGANFVTAGQIVQVLHGSYAETINGNYSGTAANPIAYRADPGVTVTGATSPNPPYSAFALSGKSYIVIDGFNITNTQGQGIYIYGSDHITISNNHVSYAGTTFASHPYTQGIYTKNMTYSTITGNTTDHNTCIGIRLVTSDHNLVSNNISTENFSVVETDAAGIELTGSSYNTVINNLVYSNEDSGINVYYFDTTSTGSSNNVIVGNLSYENGDHGIDNYQSPNNTIIGNTIQGNGTTGINLEGGTGKGSFGSTVENNILSANGLTPPSGSWGGNLRFDTNSITGATTDYNLFNRDPRATVQIVWNNINYASLALFKAAVSGQEVHGLEGDPLFVNPVAPVLRQTGVPYVGLGIFGNYYPSAGTPEIDSANADAPNEPATDVAGNSRIDDPATPNTGVGARTYDDRGAYEYLPAGPSLPIVTTQACTSIGLNTATGNGTIAATGLPNPTQHGVVWGLYANPTVLDNKTVDGPVGAPGAFTSSITDLTPGTLYHVRAYATNDVGTVYGEDVTCIALLAPAVTTQAVTNISAMTATGNGNVTALGVPSPAQHGVVWSTSANPTTADSKTTDGAVSAIGAFTSSMTGLTPGTLYHVRAYATNDAATVYGDEVTFTTLIVPTVTTQPVSNILTTTAVGNGNVTFLGIPNPTQHGVVWAITANPTTANSRTTDGPVSATGAFTSTITGLTPNALYHVRAYATNTAGTVYGEDVTFTTLLAPTVTTQACTNIATTTATGNGNVTVLGSSNPTEHGVVWGTSLNPTIADNKTTDGPVTVAGPFTSSLTGLTPGTLYHVRAYATNDGGTSYGGDVTCTTLIAPTVTTQAVTNITQTTAMLNGTIVSLGVPNPTQYGFVWDINPHPTVALPTRTEKGSATVTGAFTSSITGLNLGQTYYVRAYATNTVGTAYTVDDVVFTTLASSLSTTTPVTNARSGADVGTTGVAWLNSGNIIAADTNYAQVTLSSATSHYLEGTNYGFAIPSNATINGIQVTIGRYESGQGTGTDVRDSVVSLMKSGTLVGSNKAATSTEWPTANTTASYGANNDLWGTTWTADDINANNFGVALSANSSNNRTAYVDTMQIAVTYTVSIVSSTTTVNCGTGTPVVTYGSSITCVATVVRGSGTFTPTGNISWTTNGSGGFVPASCTLSGSNGTATCSVTYTPSAVGTGSHLITAGYAGDASFNPSSGNQTLTVNKIVASVTPNAASKTYGDADPTLTGTLAGFLPADGVTSTYGRLAGETVAGGPYTISATLSPAGVLPNYTITYNTAAFTIIKKAASVTVNAASKTYGDADPALTGTLTGFVPADGVMATYTRVAGETVAGSPYTISAVLSPAGVLNNYTITNTPANFTINKKDASVTVTAASKTYGDADPTLTGTLTGFVPGDNVTAIYSRVAGETVASSPYTISAVLSPAGVLNNYTITNTPANFTINKKDASATPNAASKPLGQPDPTLTGTLSGFLPADNVTAVYSRAAGEAVGTYPISATLSPAGVLGNYNITDTPATFTITAPLDEYTLTINKTGNGTVTKAPDQATYHYGDIVTLTATADPGWTFFNWSANAPGGIVTMHGNTTVTALFTQDEYTLTINKTGNGAVTKTPNQATYHYGAVVTLSATPDPGWSFGAWSANVVDGNVTIHDNTSVSVTFTQDEDSLTVDKVGSGSVAVDPVKATYHYGDVVSLTATPDLGWSFGSWSANAIGGTVTIHGNTTVTATFTQDEYTLTVDKVGNGSVTKLPDQSTYHYGNVVTLTATSDPGWSFGSWSANVVAGQVTVTANTTVTATFTQDEYTLTIDKVGNGAVTKAPDQSTYHYGDIVTLTAMPDAGWSFGSWSANVVAGKVTINGNTSVTATFTQDEYTLTIDKVGYGSVTKAPDQATYHYGDVVTLTATPDSGWSFGSWSANATGGSVTVHANTTVSATFTQDEYTLTIDKIGNGIVAKAPNQATYHYGDVVTLTATPDAGWSFGAWSANVVDEMVTIHNNTTVSALFTQDAYSLTIDKVGNGGVTKAPDQPTYHYGDVVTLTAAPDAGWSFGSWSANATGGTVTIHGNTTVTATFTQDEYTLTIDKVGNGTVTKAPDQATYHYGDIVTLTATPDASWGFVSWSANVVAGQVTINANTTVTATFMLLSQPTVTTQAVTNVGDTTATGNGNITDLGVPNPTQYGVVWDTAINPTVALSTKTAQGVPASTGAFTSSITGLTQGTLYHVRAYATNSVGTVYGDDVTFTTIYTVGTTTAATNARTGASGSGGGTAWTNPGNITADDTSYATASLANNVNSNYLQGTSYGFSIPANATITGIQVTIGRSGSSTTNGVHDVNLYLLKAGTLTGNNKGVTGTTWPTSITSATYGGTSDLWGGTWTPADINNTNFGVELSATSANTTSRTASVDYMQLTVTYTVPTDPTAPTVTTQPAGAITSTTATGNGNITSLGVPNPIQYGVVWDTAPNPDIALSTKTAQGPIAVTGAFTSSITGLTPNKLYHVRAYATNAAGTSYGSDATFTTLPLAPTVTTQAATAITTTTATGNGNITDPGLPAPTQYGMVWDTAINPTIAVSTKTQQGVPAGTGAFTSSITGLTPGTLYHVRAYATNTAATSYGADVTFTTVAVAPTVTTQAVSSIGTTTATGNGTITGLGGPNPTYGVVWDTNINPTIALTTKTTQGPATVIGAFTSSITGLTPGTTYHVRAYATNTAGTAYGDDVTFTALMLPTVTTEAVTAITPTTATGNGTITNLGIPNPTQYGVVWDTVTNPTVALSTKTTQGVPAGTGAFTSPIAGLTPGTVYYVRAYVTNAAGTSYGVNQTFTTTAAVWIYTTPGTANWTAPAGVTSVTVEVWGGGGKGGSRTSSGNGGGGGGGAYSSSTITVVPGNSYSYTVGAGATSTAAGGDSFFINNTTLMAKGGGSVADNTATGATGGVSGSGYGSTKYSGGSGATGSGSFGGGGGSSAGSAANGNSGSSATGGSAPTGGGAGGAGRSGSSGNGTNGSTPGGAGGGAYRTSGGGSPTGGTGANGQVKITYNYATVIGTTTSVNCGGGTPSVVYGSSITCVATVTAASGTTSPSGSVSWTSSGAGAIVTSPCTLSGTGGSASCSVTYTPSSVGSGSHLISATYGGNASFTGSNYGQIVTVNKKAASVTPTAASKVLGDTDPILTGTLTGFLSADNVTATYSRVAGEGVGTYTISAVLNPAGVLPNYNITYNTANFTITPNVYTLTVSKVGSGTVASSPSGIDCGVTCSAAFQHDAPVTLTAVASAGWTFNGWSAVGCPGTGSCTVTMDANKAVTATFTQDEYTLTIVSDNGTVTEAPSQATYHYGDVVLLTATATNGWAFANWSGDLVSSINPDSVTIHGNTTVTVNYAVVTNGAPSFTSTPVTGVNQGALYTYSITATDPNAGDPLTITAPTKPAWLTFTDNGNGSATLTGTPANADVGSQDVVLHVSDGALWVEQAFSVTVANVNDAPSFTSSPVTSGAEGSVYTYSVIATDPDHGDTLTITAPIIPAWLTLTDLGGGTASLTGTPGNDNVGINNVTLRVNDGTVNVDQVFTIDVGNTNQGPSFTSTAVTTVDEDAVYTYNITASDPDVGDTLTITAPTLPAWLTFTANQNGTALLTGTPTNSQVGDHAVVLQVSDGLELANQSFTITVVNTNDAPVLAQPADQTSAKGDVIGLQLSATDVDAGNILSYAATGLPGGLSIDSATGLISGTLTADANTYNVTATVNDGNGGTDSKSFNWVVSETAYTLTVTKVGNGTVTTDKAAPYHLNDVVGLTALADDGWTFSGWSGACTGSGACSVTMDGNKTVTATFTQLPTIVVLGQPSGTLTAWDHSFHWTGISAATWYMLEVQTSGGTLVLNHWYSSAEAGCAGGTDCVISPTETANLANGAYKWSIQDYGSYGYGPQAAPQDFTLNIPPVGAVLGQPSGTLAAWAHSFHWTGVSGATWYQLEVQGTGGSTLLSHWYSADTACVALACSVTPAETMNLTNGIYHWRIQDYGPYGYGTLTAFQGFTIVLGQPSGALTIWDHSFQWAGVSDANWYHLEVQDAGGSTLLDHWYSADTACVALACSVTPAETMNLANGIYHWRIQDYGPYGYGTQTALQDFTLNLGPVIAVLGQPSGTLTTWDHSFHWMGVGGATWYQLEVQNAGGSTILSQWYSADTACVALACSVTPAETMNLTNGIYHWRVQDYGPYGYGTLTALQDFTLNTGPSTAVLGQPSDTLTSWDGSFHWTGVGGATWYALEVQNAGGSTILSHWYSADTACVALACSVTPVETMNLTNGIYHWRIQDYGPYGYGTLTALQDFTLNTAPSIVVLGDPSSTLTSWDGSFHWTGVGGATWYQLEVQNAGGSTILSQWYSADTACVAFACSVTPAETMNLTSGTYHWRIQDYGTYGYGTQTALQDFTLNIP